MTGTDTAGITPDWKDITKMNIEMLFENLPIIIGFLIIAIIFCLPLLFMQERRKKLKQESFEREVYQNHERISNLERIITE